MSEIGIMGGTFDPIHYGHLMLGTQACKEYRLDRVLFMPSGNPPHKQGQKIAAANDRLAMVKLAMDEEPQFVCSDFEIRRPGLTYSSDTLALLHKEYPGTRFYFIVGADSFFEIETWHEPAQVLKLAVLLVARRALREGESEEEEAAYMEEQRRTLLSLYDADIRFLHCRELPVSSTEIREREEAGQSIRGLTPEAVIHYIEEHGLYRQAAEPE